jgi:hypothetical protein
MAGYFSMTRQTPVQWSCQACEVETRDVYGWGGGVRCWVCGRWMKRRPLHSGTIAVKAFQPRTHFAPGDDLP